MYWKNCTFHISTLIWSYLNFTSGDAQNTLEIVNSFFTSSVLTKSFEHLKIFVHMQHNRPWIWEIMKLSLFLEFTEKETKSQVKRLKFVPFKKARLLSVFVKKFLGKSEYPSTLRWKAGQIFLEFSVDKNWQVQTIFF